MLITLYEERRCLWDASHKDYLNRDSKDVAHSQIDLLMSDKYDINRGDYKNKWKSVYHYTHAQLICFRNNVSSFCHGSSKTFCLFPASLATQGNITRNNASATMFPSLQGLNIDAGFSSYVCHLQLKTNPTLI